MINGLTTCHPDRIELYLQQKLGAEEQASFESHLTDCGDCCRRLEASAANDDVWRQIRDSLKDDQLPSAFSPLLPGEGDLALDSTAGEEAFSSQATILKLLSPTDDDRSLGRWGIYEVMGVVGTGGMGVVLKALDAALNRYVAIKILAPHLGSSGAARKRFSREAQASAAVVHDNVIEIYGVSEAAGLPYLVMPYVRGPSLQRRLDDEGPLAVVEILRVAMQAAAGLAAAHAQGLVHRDVKPANILLADGIERVKLTDFGLARAADDASLTRTGIIAGTPQYMSPEQARGEPVDQRSDLFSLGSVLYAMCTGRPPFRAETSYGVLRRITDDEPRPIREINPDIPDWLCGIVEKLMAKRPDDRFQTAREVTTLLEQCLAHVQQPTVVPLPQFSPLPPGEGQGVRAADVSRRPQPFASWSGRKRIVAAAIALLFFGGVGLASGIIIRLKKDNKTTTIEVPDGSNAHIDADGSVTVELPNSRASAARSSERNLPALCFDGHPGSYVSIPNMDMNQLTFATWVKRNVTRQKQYLIMPQSLHGWGVFFSEREGALSGLEPDNDYLWFTAAGLQGWHSDAAVIDTRWHFVAVTLEDHVLHFYLDGEPAGKASMPYTIKSSGDYGLGGVPDDAIDSLRGCLAETLIFDRALGSVEVAQFFRRGRGLGPFRDLLDGLVAGYCFDEGQGTTANDFSGHGRDGTLHGGVKWVSDKGTTAPHAHALQFDGRHYAKIDPPPKFTSGDFTISLWFNPTTAGRSKMLFHRGFGYRDQPGDIDMHLNVYSGNVDFQARTADNQWLFGWDIPESRLRSAVRYGQWNHAVVTRRGKTYAMWMNGALVGIEKSSADISDAENTNPFIVGGVMEDNGVVDMFQGGLDDFRIFRRCLSDKEIGTLYDRVGDPAALDGEGRVKIGPLTTGRGADTDNAAHGPALCFDGQPGSYVSIPNMDMNRLTFATWVKRDVTQQKQYMIMSSGTGGWGVYLSETTGSTDYRGTSNDLLWFTDRGHNCWSSDEAVADTDWHFVAVTLEEDLLHFYIDGKPAGKAVMPNNLAGQGGDYWLGGVTPNDTNPHDGLRGCLAETLIFDRALDPDDIATLYRRGRKPQRAMMDGLIAGYHFDEGHGTTVNDFSDHGNNGKLHGGVQWLRDVGALPRTPSYVWYYVLTQLHGHSTVRRFAITGTETVLDAVANIGGLSMVPIKTLWIERPAPDSPGGKKILRIDWDGIAQGARPDTNYQLLPGDTLYISDDERTESVPFPSTTTPHPHALQFDGRHYAKVDPPPKFTSGDFTISLWFKPTTSGRSKMLFHRGFGYRDQAGDVDMHLNIYSGELDFAARTADNEWLFGWDIPESRLRSAVRYDRWNHAVATRRGKTYTMWMNGARVASEESKADISDADNTNPFIVGGIMENNGVVDMFQGALDDFRIFRRCLSDKEIGTLYDCVGNPAALDGEGRVKIGPLIEGHNMNSPHGVRSPWPATFSRHARAVQFDGRHYAKVDPPPKFTSGDFTISIWFNPVRVHDWICLFMRGFGWHDQQGDIGLKFDRDNGNLDFEARTADQQWLFGWGVPESRLRGAVRYGQWNHAVVTRRGDTYCLWMNGARVASEKSSADISDADNTDPLTVGGMIGDEGAGPSVGPLYQGALDDFRIFRRSLSDKEIGTLYDCGGDAVALGGEGRVKFGPLVPGSGAETGAVQWPKAKGGNGHWYEAVLVPDGITWTDAKNAAKARGGYLATITSPEENAFVYSLVDDDRFWRLWENNDNGPWLGGAYDRKTKAWHWVTGEPWDYTNWYPGQPDHLEVAQQLGFPDPPYPQDALHFYGGKSKRTPMWDDNWHEAEGTVGYVVEWNSRPEVPAPRHADATIQPLNCVLVDEKTGERVRGNDFTISLRYVIPRTKDRPWQLVDEVFLGPNHAGTFNFTVPDKVLRHPDRDMILVEWTIVHPRLDARGERDPIRVNEILNDDPRTARQSIRRIKMHEANIRKGQRPEHFDEFAARLYVLQSSPSLNILHAGRDEVVAAYERLLKRFPDHPDRAAAMFEIFANWASGGPYTDYKPDPAKATEWLRKACAAARPGTPLWYESRFHLEGRVRYESADAAQKLLDEILASHPGAVNEVRAWYDKQIVALFEQNKPDEAEKICRRLQSMMGQDRLPVEGAELVDYFQWIQTSARTMLSYWDQHPSAENKAKIDALRRDFPFQHMQRWTPEPSQLGTR